MRPSEKKPKQHHSVFCSVTPYPLLIIIPCSCSCAVYSLLCFLKGKSENVSASIYLVNIHFPLLCARVTLHHVSVWFLPSLFFVCICLNINQALSLTSFGNAIAGNKHCLLEKMKQPDHFYKQYIGEMSPKSRKQPTSDTNYDEKLFKRTETTHYM